MDIFDEISQIKDRDVIFTLKTPGKWSTFARRLHKLRRDGEPFLYESDYRPMTVYGMKCYIVFSDRVKCWLKVLGVDEIDGKIFLKLEPLPNNPDYPHNVRDFDGIKYFIRGIREQ